MREILFRGKVSDSCRDEDLRGQWVEGNLVHQTEYYGSPIDRYHILYTGEFDYDYYDSVIIIPETIVQYTGLKDKNGAKIFEGDIVRYKKAERFSDPYEMCNAEIIHDRVEVVKFENGKFSPLPYCDICYDYWYSHGAFDFEVIGNIYDNPTLLEVTT